MQQPYQATASQKRLAVARIVEVLHYTFISESNKPRLGELLRTGMQLFANVLSTVRLKNFSSAVQRFSACFMVAYSAEHWSFYQCVTGWSLMGK